MEEIDQRIRAARVGAGFRTAAEAARSLNMEAHAYRHYETGKRLPPINRVSQMAALYRVSIGWLVEGKKTDERRTSELLSLWNEMSPDDQKTVLRLIARLAAAPTD